MPTLVYKPKHPLDLATGDLALWEPRPGEAVACGLPPWTDGFRGFWRAPETPAEVLGFFAHTPLDGRPTPAALEAARTLRAVGHFGALLWAELRTDRAVTLGVHLQPREGETTAEELREQADIFLGAAVWVYGGEPEPLFAEEGRHEQPGSLTLALRPGRWLLEQAGLSAPAFWGAAADA